MSKLPAPLRKRLDQDYLVKKLRSDFEKIPDHRAANIVHQLSDVLMSAYAMYALKYPSLNSFEQQTKSERENLKNLFGVEKLCSDAQMRRVLDEVNPEQLHALFPTRFSMLKRLGIKKEYLFLRKYLLVPIDGVQYFSSQKVNCSKCLTSHHGNDEISYSHSMLAAVLVHPNKREVFPLSCESIERQDGRVKNDCERNAAKRLINKLLKSYEKEPIVILADALHANEPQIEQILSSGWDYLMTAKPIKGEVLFKHFRARKQRNEVEQLTIHEDKMEHRFYWMNNVPLNGKGNVRTNFLFYECIQPDGKVRQFSWVTSIKLHKRNVIQIMKAARARWKIENETFNTLKNQGYHFEHNYGHGYKHLSNVLALIMLLAFLIDQIIQARDKVFKIIEAKVKTKKRLWHTRRALFSTTVLQSFKDLMRKLASEYEILLE